MKKFLTLIAIFMATVSMSAQETKSIERDLELTGTDVTLPPNYVTGRAKIDFLGRYAEMRFYDLNAGDDATADQYIDISTWPYLHLEFEQLPDSMQVHLEGSSAKYSGLDNTVSPLVYDFNIAETGLAPEDPLNKIGLQNTSKSTSPRTVIITKCCLRSSDAADADELPLYYSPKENYSSFYERIIWSDSKLLSGKVDFHKANAQLGGESWVPKEDLANATKAVWTIELNDPLPSGDFQLKVEDSNRGYYYGLDEGQSVITFDFSDRNPNYSPSVLSDITKVSLRYNDNGKNQNDGDMPQTLDIKSVKVKIDEPAVTGINSVKRQTLDVNAPIYNLAGQRVKSAKKGVYIQNGRKFIVK